MKQMESFIQIFEIPPAMRPYIDLIVNEQEIDLVVGLAGQTMTLDQIAQLTGMTPEEAEPFLTEAFKRRAIVIEDEQGVTTYRAATFNERMRPLTMYEHWGGVPEEARKQVAEAHMAGFLEARKPLFAEVREDPAAFDRLTRQHVLLLHEALEQTEAASVHMVVPCDCRALALNCDRPSETCLWYDEMTEYVKERGRVITKEEAKAILIQANRDGQIHLGPRDWREDGGPNSICNCCTCCCHVFRAGEQLDMIGVWPKAFYVASRDEEKCNHCNICVSRCHFDAFYHDGTTYQVNGKKKKRIRFNPDNCWGCGLCATACPEAAITMKPLPGTIVYET